MLKQFFGKTFLITLASLFGVFLLSILLFESSLSLPVLVLIGLITLGVSIWKLEYGVFILFAELFANSHGHLITTGEGGQGGIGMRMAVFGGLMAGWCILLLAKKVRLHLKDSRLTPFYFIAIALLFGFGLGFLENPSLAFSDGNAYLYFLAVLPILSIEWTGIEKNQLLQVFAATAIWVTVLTLGLLYVFTHWPGHVFLPEAYRFIRDTRTGELTEMNGGLFRVFLQSQYTVSIFALLLAPWLWLKGVRVKMQWQTMLLLALCGSAIFVSLSRSFWVGLVAGAIVFLGLFFKTSFSSWKNVLKAIGFHTMSKIAALLILIVIVLFPFPQSMASLSDLTNTLSERSTEFSGAAIDSRWKLLPPMLDLIAESPIVGHGFGKEVEFITDDPRVREFQPDGKWKTFALEWGWFELWLKMGVLGPIAFIYLFYVLIRGLRGYLGTEQAWLGLGMIASLIFLAGTHAFSPYLNHPLGIGFLLFLIPFLLESQPKKKQGMKVPAVHLPSLSSNTESIALPSER